MPAKKTAEELLEEAGFVLPEPPTAVAKFVQTKTVLDRLVFTSGHLPVGEDGALITGRVDNETMDTAQKAAERAVLGVLASLKMRIGSLYPIKSVVNLRVMVNGIPEFKDHPQVANAASELLAKVFGEVKGVGTREAFGADLPLNAMVEISMIVELQA